MNIYRESRCGEKERAEKGDIYRDGMTRCVTRIYLPNYCSPLRPRPLVLSTRSAHARALYTRSSTLVSLVLFGPSSTSPTVIRCLRSFYSFTESSTVCHHGVGYCTAKPWHPSRYEQHHLRTTMVDAVLHKASHSRVRYA